MGAVQDGGEIVGFDFKHFCEDRNNAFIAFVMNDDWNAVKEYCTNYGVKMPDDPDVMAAGIYKAVQEVADIPDLVKITAAMKCLKIDFTPFITPPDMGART